MHRAGSDSLRVMHTCTGRAVHVRSDGRLYMSRGYTIYSSDDNGETWVRVTAMPVSSVGWFGNLCRLASRLLRFDVLALAMLLEGTYVASSRHATLWLSRGGERCKRLSAAIQDR